MPRISQIRLNDVVATVASQLEIIETLRLSVTEEQAASANHNEQEMLQAQLDRFTAIAANLNRALEELAA